MGTIAGILAVGAIAHLGSAALGGVLAKLGVLGFGGPRLRIARHVLRVGKALRAAHEQERNAKTRGELKRWLEANDPENESGLGERLTAASKAKGV